jgi:acylphosphatase
MENKEVRAEILLTGLVQGVGFRYFVTRHAERLGLKGYTRNLYSGEVEIVVEGERYKIEELISEVKTGPSHAHVNKCRVEWAESKNEFTTFGVKY